MKTSRVYKITSPSNKVYIGSTARTLKERWSDYKRLNCKRQIHLYNSFIKYGVENHKFEQLWEGDISEMLKKEFEFGKLYNVLDRNVGLNCKLPKELDDYQCFSEDTRERLRESWKTRKPVSDITKKKLSDSMKRRVLSGESFGRKKGQKIGKYSEEARKKMSESAKNRAPMSELTKSKISISSSNMSIENRKLFSERMKGNKYSLGIKASKETRLKMSITRKIPILQYDLEGNFIKEWNSATDAGKELGIDVSNISACCKNKVKRVKIFKFKYK